MTSGIFIIRPYKKADPQVSFFQLVSLFYYSNTVKVEVIACVLHRNGNVEFAACRLIVSDIAVLAAPCIRKLSCYLLGLAVYVYNDCTQ